MNHYFRWTSWIATAVVALFLPCSSAVAQEVGHYIQGAAGLDAGTAAPPGLFLTYLPWIDFVDSVKDSHGRTVLKGNLKIAAHNFAISSTFETHIPGLTYGFSFIAPVVNQRLDADRLPSASFGHIGLSDLGVTPLILGYEKSRMDFVFNYTFYTATGAFNPDRFANTGLGFWENQFQLGTTAHLDKSKTIDASILTTWELNQKVSGLDITPGTMFTAEYGLGKKFLHGGLNVGVSGSFYHNLTTDSGTGTTADERGIYGQSMSLGPEVSLTLPVSKTSLTFVSLLVRYQPEFDVRSRTSGQVLVVGMTVFQMFPPKR